MIWSVLGDSQGVLWIGTENGLNRLDRKTGQFTLYRHDPKNPHSLSFDKVSAIREDRSGTSGLDIYGGGLNRFDRATGRFFSYRHDPKDPPALQRPRAEPVARPAGSACGWGPQEEALNRFDRNSGRFTVYRDEPKVRGIEYVNSIFEDRAGILWLGTFGGLSRFDPRTEQFTVYRTTRGIPPQHHNDECGPCMRIGRGGCGSAPPAVSMSSTGACGTFTSITQKDGLAGNAVRAILEDGEGYLWLATDGGLSRFHPPTRTFRNFTESDGLPGNLLNPYGLQGTWQSPSRRNGASARPMA